MDVCDVNGDKIGSISRVYRRELARVGGGETGGVATMPQDDILEVKTGLFGLGKHYYVPFDAIQDVTSECIFIKEPKERVDDMGWEVKPDHLEEMS
jgi:hypothetical protein